VKEYLDKSEDELLEIIGESVEDDTLGFFPIPKTRAELRERATKRLNELHAVLHDAICGNAEIRRLFHSPERELMFHAVCDIVTALSLGLHVGAITAYLVRRGIHTLCNESSS
jgi:hypothetical protein